MPEELVPREELQATLEARQELGPAYEDALVERFAAELERRLAARLPAERPRRAPSSEETGIIIVSILAAIPLIGVAGAAADLPGVIAICAALVLVNYLVLRR